MISGSPRMLVVMTLVAAIIIGAIIAVATGQWWVLILAVALHFTGTAVVTKFIFGRIDQEDKPSPTEEARLEDQRAGV